MRSFSEEDFASWLDQLGERLVAAPDWRALLVYRGVSAWEAGYWLFYHGFLDALRVAAAGTETPTWDLHSRFRPARLRMLSRSVALGEMGLREVPISIASRLLYRVRMSLPSQKWPGANGFPRALILEAFPNNLTTLVPVARVLDRDLNWDVLFAGWGPKLEGPVREAGLKFAGIEALFRRRLIRLETQHYRDVELALARLELQELVALLQELSGIPLAVNPRGLLHRVCVLVRTFTDVYNEMRDRWEPDVIVLANEHSPPGRTIANVAALAGIPTVTLQHGLYAQCPAYRRLSTDRLLVWGKLSREFWLARGCSPDQVLVTGAVRYDTGERPSGEQPAAQSVQNPHPMVLVAWQTWGSEFSEAQHHSSPRALLDAAARLPQVQFVFKTHPGEGTRAQVYRKALDSTRLRNVRLVTQGPIQPLIEACDLLVTFFSTAAIEAMSSDRPVLMLHLSPDPRLAPYAQAGAAALVSKENELAATIARLLEDETERKALIEGGCRFIRDYLGPLDGRSAWRAAQAIAEAACAGPRAGQFTQEPIQPNCAGEV